MNFLKKTLKTMMNLIPLTSTVILESNPDMSDNTYSLYNKMIERGYNNKYKFYWLVNNPDDFKDTIIKNVYFRKWKPDTLIEKFEKLWLLYTAKFIIVCNKYIEKRREGQVVAALGHGTILKSVKQYKMIGADCDFTLCPSDYFVDIYCDQLKLSKEQMLISGYPRNDLLFENGNKLNQVLSIDKFKKIIIWMPTFRKQKNSQRIDSNFDFGLGIPIIYNAEDLIEINNLLASLDILLILKLHPAQDTSVIKASSLSNLILLNDETLEKAGVKLYQILSDTDALITDYSSIYYDYLLLNKMIGITLDDFESYSQQNGFPFDNVLDILKGDYIYTKTDLINFIKNVSDEIDNHQKERTAINEIVNKYRSGSYSDFVLDYLIKYKQF